jgi:hypothetical protein
MKEYKRYFCHIRVDISNVDIADISVLNEKIENVLEEWSQENADNGISTDIGWNWSEHINLD